MKKTTRLMGTAVMVLAITMMTVSGTEKVMASSMHLGNNSANILNGGILSQVQDGVTYFANTEDGNRLYRVEDDNYTRLSNHAASQINVIGGKIYYVTNGNTVMCYDLSDKSESVCFSVEAGIDEMYVNHSEQCYYLSDGDVYERSVASVEQTDGTEAPRSAANAIEMEVTEDAISETEAYETEAPETEAVEDAIPETEAEEIIEEDTTEAETAVAETSEEEIIPEETILDETIPEETEEEIVEEAEKIVDFDRDILHFVPTVGGMICATGRPLDYTLYAGDDVICSDVTTFYTEGDYLFINQDGENLQAAFSGLFDGDASDAVEAYDLENAPVNTSIAEDTCEACAENARKAAAGVDMTDDWNLIADSEALVNGSSDGIAASTATGIHRMLYDSSTSEGQRNMVKRAYQMHLVEWTPLQNIQGWGPGSTSMTFYAGTTYTGLPYGQPVTNNGYVPWDVSLETFVKAVKTAGSVMYTSYSSYSNRAPYYSCDCSGFVSYAWQTSGRKHTGAIGEEATTVSPKSIYSLQVGDAFLKVGSHVAMVSDIGMRDGEMVYVDVIEQTPPQTRLTRYGEGGSKTLEYMSTKYLSKGYVIIRKNNREKVTYTPSSVVAVEVEDAGTITTSVEKVRLDIGESFKITYKTEDVGDYDTSWSSSNSKIATVSNGTVTAVGTGRTYVNVSIGPTTAKVLIEVRPATVTGLAGKGVANGGIKLTWNAVADASNYIIYRRNSAGKWVEIGQTTNTYFGDMGTDLTAKALAKHTTYKYTVRAVYSQSDYADMNGYICDAISVTTVTTTPVLTGIVASSYNSQTLVWKEVEGAEAYRVYRQVTGTNKWTFVAETTKTSYLSTKLECGTSYTYTVTAYFVENKNKICSAYNTKGVTKVCCPSTPALPTITAVNGSTQKITWKEIDGADGYNIYVKVGSETAWTALGSTTGTSYVNKGLKSGTKYTYTIRAFRTVSGKKVLSGYNTTGKSKVCCLATPVLRYAATSGVGTQVVVWNAVAGAEGYVVYRKDGDDAKWKELGSVTKTACTVKNLTPGVKYIYTVRAYVTVNGKRVLSDYNTTGVYRLCTFPAVTLKSIIAVNSTTQTLTWNAMNGATGYNVYVKAGDAASWTLLGNVSETSYTNKGLTTGTKYTYTVRATVVNNGSKLLGEYNKDGISRVACPKTPALGTIKDTSYTSQTVTWTAVSDADGYNVYMKTGTSKTWELLGSVTTTSYRSVGLKCGETYTYTVRAYKKVGNQQVLSGYNTTGISRKCVPAKPALETAQVTGKNAITVTWNGVSGAHVYNVYRKTESTNWTLVGNTKSLNYTDTKLTSGETYIYTVRAIRTVSDKDIFSGYDSKGIKCKVELGKTVITAAARDERGNVVINWNPVDFADGYILYCKEPGGTWTTAGRIDDGTVGTTTLSTLDASRDYVIRVRAFWKQSNGNTYKGPDDAKGITVEKQ